MRKTPQMRALEERHKKPIEQLVATALAENFTINEAAASLGANPKTFYSWMTRLRITRRKVVEVEGQLITEQEAVA